MMTERDLDAIEARYKALPGGTWIADNQFAYWQVHAADYNMLFVPKTIWSDDDFGAEARFIAHARNHDIPNLIARVRQLEAQAEPARGEAFCRNLLTAATDFGWCGDAVEIEKFVCWQFGHSGVPYDEKEFCAALDADEKTDTDV